MNPTSLTDMTPSELYKLLGALIAEFAARHGAHGVVTNDVNVPAAHPEQTDARTPLYEPD